MNTIDLEYGLFIVGDRPYCLWDTEIGTASLRFLDSVDPAYYEYLADRHFCDLGDKESGCEQRAAIALRGAFSQGLETLFSFLCAFIQAPHCVPAWMHLYRNSDLYDIIRKISNREMVLCLLNTDHLNWETISRAVHCALSLENKGQEESVKSGFGHLWARFALILLDQGFQGEYNSIKHGLRIRPGGFKLAIGRQVQAGVPAPKESMHLLGESEFGSSYYAFEQIGDAKGHGQLRHHLRNWSPEDMAWGLYLISTSLSNIISALRITNGVRADQVRFQWPADIDSFAEPWKRTVRLGTTSMRGFSITIPQDLIQVFTRDEIVSQYKDGKIKGIRRLQIDGNSE
jgi:hypothetical protein